MKRLMLIMSLLVVVQIKGVDDENFESFYNQVNPPRKENKTLASRYLHKKAIIPATVGLGIAATAGMLYVGLRWQQKKEISKVVARHGKMQDDFSWHERDMMAAAVLASWRVPGAIRRLKSLVSNYRVASDLIPTYLMWQILAEIYYRKPINSAVAQEFRKKIEELNVKLFQYD